MGVVVFGAVTVYAIAIVAAMWFAYRWAAKRAYSRTKRWLAAMGGFLLVYLPVFWDQVPTLIAHEYYCEKEAGFWIYKTVDQWKAENPGVAETLDRSLATKLYDPSRSNRFWSTQRFYVDISRSPEFHAIGRTEQVFIDAVTREPLARGINFWRGEGGNAFALGGSLEDYRRALILGWGNRECGKPSPADQMARYRRQFELLGEKK